MKFDFVDAVMKDVRAQWQTIMPQGYRPTRVVLFRDVINSACGMAQSARVPLLSAGWARVSRSGILQELSRRFGAPGDFARAYVIAHEVGHHVQRLSGILGSGSNASSVAIELQADCLAGVWGHAAAQPGRAAKGQVELEPGDVEEGLNAAAAIGDDRLQKMAPGRPCPSASRTAARRNASVVQGSKQSRRMRRRRTTSRSSFQVPRSRFALMWANVEPEPWNWNLNPSLTSPPSPPPDRFGAAFVAPSFSNRCEMGLHRPLADVERGGNLLCSPCRRPPASGRLWRRELCAGGASRASAAARARDTLPASTSRMQLMRPSARCPSAYRRARLEREISSSVSYREDDQARLRIAVANPANDLHAFHDGHPQVEQRDVRTMAFVGLDRLDAVAGFGDHAEIRFLVDDVGDTGAEQRVIVNQEHARLFL
jgi:hypothetical protein